jgi:hypothetical protein
MSQELEVERSGSGYKLIKSDGSTGILGYWDAITYHQKKSPYE